MIRRLLVLMAAMLLLSLPAKAGDFKVLTVDYSRAIQEINDGKKAKERLDKMYAGRQAEIENAQAEIIALQREYESKAAVLTDASRQDYERRLYEKQAAFQQLYASADMEFQQAYMTAMERLMTGLGEVAAKLGEERGADLVLEVSQGMVLYAKPGLDVTDEVIKRYNATH